MSDLINFELVSPEEKLVSEPVKMAVIPGEEGEFGVLPGHSSLVSVLKAGVVELHGENGGDVRKIFIAGGFADVTAEQCTVLAEEAINVSDIDKSEVEQQLSALNTELSSASEEIEKARIEKRIALVSAKLSAVTGTLLAA